MTQNPAKPLRFVLIQTLKMSRRLTSKKDYVARVDAKGEAKVKSINQFVENSTSSSVNINIFLLRQTPARVASKIIEA
jgi:hypothetical protein